MGDPRVWAVAAVIALATVALRFLPFLIWGGNRKAPELVKKLGKSLPCAVIGMLVVYCLRDVSFPDTAGYLPPLIACCVTGGLYIWKRSTLLSIVAGTVCYMALVQLVFK